MLINRLGEEICFSYPKDSSKSQMFFSTKIRATDIAETLRAADHIQQCATELRNECENFDFLLQGSFHAPDDLELSFKHYIQKRPETWEKFFNAMFPYRIKSDNIRRRCDTLFQVFFYLIHNGKSKTPLHVSLAESIHDICRSKNLIMNLNRLGLCVSYDEMERIDINLAQRTIDAAGENRVPVPPVINSSAIIQGAMDNFDNEENTSSGIGGSHDTILMLFQNTDLNNDTSSINLSELPPSYTSSSRSLKHILDCQKLVRHGTFSGRADIPANFRSLRHTHKEQLPTVMSKEQYKLWVLSRYLQKTNNNENIPSFTATNSLLSQIMHPITSIAFTPIVPYPATEYDTIYTVMINFQDVLRQKGLRCGPLWSDEGVYRIAKELQFLYPARFENIFLGIGGFHMEKVIIACCGKYLEEIGMDHVLVENEIFGTHIVKSALDGGNYIRGKRGVALISEAICHLQLSAFMKSISAAKFENFFTVVSELQLLFENVGSNPQQVLQKWEECKKESASFMDEFDEFKDQGGIRSKSFAYWNKFIDEIASVLRDLTRSFREGNWELHLSAVQRAMPLCFAYDRVNYKRWLPIYFEDCLSLPAKYPEIYETFKNGGFIVKHTNRQGSGVPLDQALEKAYNKPAKSQSGIIGFSRRKEAVCKWNIIKHEKEKYTSFLREWCLMDYEDEYSLHHEFAKSTTETDISCVNQMIHYIQQRFNPFDVADVDAVVNIVTGTHLSQESTQFLLDSLRLGEQACNEFFNTRLEEKSVKLFDTIPKTRKSEKSNNKDAPKVDLKKETIKFMRYIDYARIRNYNVGNLLQHELTSNSFYLFKDGYPRKPDKAELASEIKKLIDCPSKLPPPTDNQMVIIDFMAYARKVPTKKLKLKTFSDLAAQLWSTFQGLSRTCIRTDIVFDLYRESSIKGSERNRRSKTAGIYTTVAKGNQPLPVEFDKFWSLSSNKVSFQQFFIIWLATNCNDDINIYLGGSHKDDESACMRIEDNSLKIEPTLWCSHEEADDRMMFHMSQAVKIGHFQNIIIASPDTDVLVCSIYHFNQLKYSDLSYLWFITGRSTSKTFIPIHSLVNTFDSDIVEILPAVHALTGCDSTSKVGTKSSALKKATECGYALLYNFGKSELSEVMISNAEFFLLKCLAPKSKAHNFDQYRCETYHRDLQFNIEKFPPTSSSIEQHIKRAYFQCHLWLHAPFVKDISTDPLTYGYTLDERELLMPITLGQSQIPDDFPSPCTCVKCVRENVCPCRVKNIACCEFCKCKAGPQCKNSHNQ